MDDPANLIVVGQLICKIHHQQPINVPTAGAQAFHMDYT
jgi:hypothetical protein